MFYMYNKLLNLALNIALRYRRHAERKTQLLELYTLKIRIKCMIIPEIWAKNAVFLVLCATPKADSVTKELGGGT